MATFTLRKTIVYFAAVEADTLEEAIEIVESEGDIISENITGTSEGDWEANVNKR